MVLNDLLTGATWSTLASWPWKFTSHINVLESHAYVALLNRLAQAGGSLRFLALLDLRVAKGLMERAAHRQGLYRGL